MNLLRLLCQGSAPLLAKVRLAICLLSAAVPAPGAAHRCYYIWVIICGSGGLFGVYEKGQRARIILCVSLSLDWLYFPFILWLRSSGPGQLRPIPQVTYVLNWRCPLLTLKSFSPRWWYFCHILWEDEFVITRGVLKGCSSVTLPWATGCLMTQMLIEKRERQHNSRESIKTTIEAQVAVSHTCKSQASLNLQVSRYCGENQARQVIWNSDDLL